ncbi:hypothetical protein WJX81_004439 [Elliptochloris bilobata]|uniref:Uracil-DNA glycosylase n=1 Tax=Elliptochloris bilobata TaxID=381761 RepID=A0AAW1QLH5_9CHLO
MGPGKYGRKAAKQVHSVAVVRARTVSHVEVLTPEERAALAGRSPGGASDAPAEATGALTTEQQFQIAANRAMALARRAASAAAKAGTPPALTDLLTEETWRRELAGELERPHAVRLTAFLATEWRTQSVFPSQPLIFRAFNSCPFERVRVVIIGQDPYHNDGQAMGLSFSVPPGQKVPSSLQNMYRELADDCGCAVPNHGDLEKWASQGVFLLNAVLTVRAHAAASHAKHGWEPITDAAIRALSAHRKGLVFMLWGRFAQQKAALIDTSRHHVLTAAHPSGLSARKGFFGCKHFSKANALLAKEGLPQIDWCIGRV